MNHQPPPTAQWTPPAVTHRPASNIGIVVALIGIGLIAAAALVIGIIDLTRPASNGGGVVPTVQPPSTFTAKQTADAKKNLCTMYQVAARSVKEDTNGPDIAIARISLTNGAGMLDAATDNPALGQSERDAARNLAAAYRNAVAISSVFDKTSSVFQQSLDDVNRLDGIMAAICP
ncbi:hypothetical protein BST25_18100 [Mycobacterium heidelbergense]|uniref:Uncharacterized protein n=2 Tax=Mycobacterium heidelbergense TaxID=53376 RepID=A0A1X0DFD9_MYCHE|nr:hypothetical protein BST25_18100 [Mycobacterium heidelbergense]BBZ50401.1 hypothetical protein MHEI_21180 [Mycobacterium heidelbergense]